MAGRRSGKSTTFPLEDVALGLLMAGPKHGYELYQDFVEAFGPIWKAGRSKFYAVLARLQQQGLLQAAVEPQEDRPPRKVYRLTDVGREAFLEWVYRPVIPMRRIRVELLAKLRFFDILPLPDPYSLIDAQIEACEAALKEWEQRADDYLASEGDPFYTLVYEYRQRQIQFFIDWLNYCKTQLREG
jgi:PadR family transcriptional regulator AphA